MANKDNETSVFWIMIFIIIIILIPLFLELLLQYTNGRKSKQLIYQLALNKAKELKQPLLIFNSTNEGYFINTYASNCDGKTAGTATFNGPIQEIVPLLNDKSVVIMLSDVLEYIPTESLPKLIADLLKASDNNLYVVSVDTNSPRIYYDYKITNVMTDSFNLPNGNPIKYVPINSVQQKLHQFYQYVFMIVPYKFFTYYPVNIK